MAGGPPPRYYIRARDFLPDLSRWLTTDPLWPDEERFNYAIAWPILLIDPSGSQSHSHGRGSDFCKKFPIFCPPKPRPKPVGKPGIPSSGGVQSLCKSLGIKCPPGFRLPGPPHPPRPGHRVPAHPAPRSAPWYQALFCDFFPQYAPPDIPKPTDSGSSDLCKDLCSTLECTLTGPAQSICVAGCEKLYDCDHLVRGLPNGILIGKMCRGQVTIDLSDCCDKECSKWTGASYDSCHNFCLYGGAMRGS